MKQAQQDKTNPQIPPEDSTQENTSPIDQVTLESNSEPETSHKRKHLIRYFIMLVLIVGAGLGGWYLSQHNTKQSTTVTTQQTKSSAPTYVFYTKPTKLADLHFFTNTGAVFGTNCTGLSQTTNCPPQVEPNQISYAQIGLTPTKRPIVVAYDYDNGEGSFSYVAIEDTPNHYEINAKLDATLTPSKPSNQTWIATFKSSLGSNVTLDTTDVITPLAFPDSITIKGQSYSAAFSGPTGYFINGLSEVRGPYYNTSLDTSHFTKIGSNGLTNYFIVTVGSQPTYQVHEIYATVGGVYASTYVPDDPLQATVAPIIQWSDGTNNTVTYKSAAQGCGSAGGYVVAKGIDPAQLIQIGQGLNNQILYELSPTSTLFNIYYQDNYGNGQNLQDTSLQNLSAVDFQNDHAVIVAKNSLGEYVVYQRTDMFVGGGCGEPVLYVYPQHPTSIDIRVGASVTMSDPQYTQNGWQNVFALPSGKLTYNGKSYNALVWEGIGAGFYPLIDSGTVVARADAVATITRQLHEQGLTNSEAQDFLNYWATKLPNTPYIRLTWFNTAQMNELAPLRISPKPQTVIRVFLDFQGLNKPISIAPQKFNAPMRKGLTVVEWGGLLRGGNLLQ